MGRFFLSILILVPLAIPSACRAESVPLDGPWEIYGRAIDPSEFKSSHPPVPDATSRIPIFSLVRNDTISTLRLTFPRPQGQGHYGVRFEELGPVFRLFIDGHLVHARGMRPGEPIAESGYGLLRPLAPPPVPTIIPFEGSSELVELLIQLDPQRSALHGLMRSPRLGTIETLDSEERAYTATEALVAGILFITFLSHLQLFLMRRRSREHLYFSVFTALMLTRLLVMGERLAAGVLPGLSWAVFTRLEYVAFYWCGPTFLAFLGEVFPGLLPKNWLRAAVLPFVLLTLLLGAPFSASLFMLNAAQAIFLMVVLGCLIVAIRAVRARRPGSRLILSGLICIAGVALSDMALAMSHGRLHLFSHAFLAPSMFPVFVIFHSFVVSRNYTQAYNSVEAMTKELLRTNSSMDRFLPRTFLGLLGKGSVSDVRLGDSVVHEMTVMFCDIRNFTETISTLSPGDAFEFVNRYLSYICPEIHRYGGTIDKFMGDGIMALFPGSVDDALRAARAITAALELLNEEHIDRMTKPVRLGIGVHYGPLVIGIVGEPDRMEATSISDTVNVAARVEELTKTLSCSILVSESVYQRASTLEKGALHWIQSATVRGRTEAVGIYGYSLGAFTQSEKPAA